jgi:hypothetical protein
MLLASNVENKVSNNSESKTNYRNVFKSDHLGVIDLEEFIEAKKPLIFTISHVKQEIKAKVAGRKIDANIAYFKEGIKPLVLNAGNSKVLKDLSGSVYVEKWKNMTVELYIDRGAKLAGEIVGGVRISPKAIAKQKPVITPQNEQMWKRAKAAYVRDGNLDTVTEHAIISKANVNALIKEVEASAV